MKKRYKCILLFVCAVILFAIIIPIIINLIFKYHIPYAFLAAEWSAGDALDFYGTMLASVVTILGVYLSINYAQRNYREDEANRVRPYLALTHYHAKRQFNPFFFSKVMNQSKRKKIFIENINLVKYLLLLVKMAFNLKMT